MPEKETVEEADEKRVSEKPPVHYAAIKGVSSTRNMESTTVLDAAVLDQFMVTEDMHQWQQFNRWMIWSGFFVNGHTGGLEVKVGKRAFYAIAKAHLFNTSYKPLGIGAGTSLLFTSRLAGGLEYLYSTQFTSKSVAYSSGELDFSNSTSNFYSTKLGRQHQFHLSLTYNLYPHIVLQVGPTFNYVRQHNKWVSTNGIEQSLKQDHLSYGRTKQPNFFDV